VALLCLALPPLAAAAPKGRGVVLRCDKPYRGVEQKLAALGGHVTHRFVNLDAIAAVVPEARISELQAIAGVAKVYKDAMVLAPAPVRGVMGAPGRGAGTYALEAADVTDLAPTALKVMAASPQDYTFNNTLINAEQLHSFGVLGEGAVVAILDSGTANNPVVVPSIAGSVIGGENFVPGDPSATSTLNGNHGTWVGSIIAGHANFAFSPAATLPQSLLRHAPEAIDGPCPDPTRLGYCWVPMVGVAPLSSLYAMKIFPAAGGRAPKSRIIAAMDRALTLKKNYDQGMPSVPVSGDGSEDEPYVYDSLNIQVVNISVSGPTLWAGGDLEDELTREMLKAGQLVVAPVSNSGPGAMTGGSPGTGEGALTVGAANTAAHERVFRDLQFGLGAGDVYRAADGIQTAYFSSRGPTADGRIDPELTANGFAVFVQDASGDTSLVTGTSFSAPVAAGAAALMWEIFPYQRAGRIRNALYFSADPNVLTDGSDAIDQGAGFLDVTAAAIKLWFNPHLPGRVDRGVDSSRVAWNIKRAGLDPIRFRHNRYSTQVKDLLPGQARQLFVPIDRWTDQFTVHVTNITPALPPSDQNQRFGDDLILNIRDAPTSTDRFSRLFEFVDSDVTVPVDDPQTGIARVVVMGNWTNAGRVSADVTIERVRSAQGLPTAWGRVAEGDSIPVEVEIPDGATEAVFELEWRYNWGRFPTNDLDLILVDPSNRQHFDGVTLASPERVVISTPEAGTWLALVNGFAINGGVRKHGRHCRHSRHERPDPRDIYALRVTVDGERIR
jgi:subtilisin family serine protease